MGYFACIKCDTGVKVVHGVNLINNFPYLCSDDHIEAKNMIYKNQPHKYYPSLTDKSIGKLYGRNYD